MTMHGEFQRNASADGVLGGELGPSIPENRELSEYPLLSMETALCACLILQADVMPE